MTTAGAIAMLTMESYRILRWVFKSGDKKGRRSFVVGKSQCAVDNIEGSCGIYYIIFIGVGSKKWRAMQ